jgi:ribose 5-phosphate isomerase RpiB
MNMLCLGGRATWLASGWDLTQAFLASDVSQAERHLRRLAKPVSLERGME